MAKIDNLRKRIVRTAKNSPIRIAAEKAGFKFSPIRVGQGGFKEDAIAVMGYEKWSSGYCCYRTYSRQIKAEFCLNKTYSKDEIDLFRIMYEGGVFGKLQISE